MTKEEKEQFETLQAEKAELEKENKRLAKEVEKAAKEVEKAKGTVVVGEKCKQSKAAHVDCEVEVEATATDPYHDKGTKYKMGKANAKRLSDKGWVKILSAILILVCLGLGAQAQITERVSGGGYLL